MYYNCESFIELALMVPETLGGSINTARPSDSKNTLDRVGLVIKLKAHLVDL